MSILMSSGAPWCALLLACTLGTATPGSAQPTPPTAVTALDPIVVTAARMPQPIVQVLADVTVIGQDEILRSGVQSLAELLQRQPGVEVTQNGGPGSTSGAYLRGANTGQTLVLIDGLRAGSASSGATSLEAIPLDQIEHIEILRGPASSLYGADAIGGVVQVFTKRTGGSTFTPNFSAGFGTYDTGAVSAGFAGTTDSLRYSLQVGGRTSDGFNAITNPDNFSYNPDRDGFNTKNLSANLGWTWAAGQELSAQYFGNRLNAQSDGGAPYFDDRTITTVQAWSANSRNKINDVWTSLLTVGEGSDNSVSETGFGNFPFRTTQRQYFWQNDLTLPLGVLGVILERREEHLSTDADFAVTQRDTNSATAVYQLRHDAFALQANLRRDDSSQYGGKTTGGLALGYTLSRAWRFTLGSSTGFRAPSFNDLYYPGFSNPNLVPETAANVDVERIGRVSPMKCGGRRARSAITIKCANSSCSRATRTSTARPKMLTAQRWKAPRSGSICSGATRVSWLRSTWPIPRTTPPGIFYRDARGHTGPCRCCNRPGQCSWDWSSSRPPCATTMRRIP